MLVCSIGIGEYQVVVSRRKVERKEQMAQEAKVNNPKRGVIGSMITSLNSSQLLLMQFNNSFDVLDYLWTFYLQQPSHLAFPNRVVFVS